MQLAAPRKSSRAKMPPSTPQTIPQSPTHRAMSGTVVAPAYWGK